MRRLEIADISDHTFLWIEDEVSNKLSWQDEEYEKLVMLLFDSTPWRNKDKEYLHLDKITLSLLKGGRSSAIVLKLVFIHLKQSYGFIIRIHSTLQEAEKEKNNVDKLDINSIDCFANCMEQNELFSKNIVIYQDVCVNIVSKLIDELSESLFQHLRNQEKITVFAENFHALIEAVTQSFEKIEDSKIISHDQYYNDIRSQLPPELVISQASLFQDDKSIFKFQASIVDKIQPITDIHQFIEQLSEKNTSTQWFKLNEIWFDKKQGILTGNSKEIAYLPFTINENSKIVYLWIAINKNELKDIESKLDSLDATRPCKLNFLAEDVSFTAQLKKMGFDTLSCLSTIDFQALCEKHYSQLHLNMRHNDLHCGNVLTSGNSFKVIDVGDMKADLIASDIARLEVSLWFEMSKRLSEFSKQEAEIVIENLMTNNISNTDSLSISNSFSNFLYHLRKGFEAGVQYLPDKTQIVLAYVIQILLYQRYCLLDGLAEIPHAFNVFARHQISQFGTGGTAHVEVKNEIEVSPVKMAEKVNLCAAIQIDLARLKLFTHCHSDLSKLKLTDLKSVESTYNEIHKHLYKVVMAGQWVYPELLRGIMAAFQDFPILAVLESSHKETTPIDNILQLANRLDKHKAIDALQELAHHIHATIGLGAQEHCPIYETIAKLILKINGDDTLAQGQIEIRQQFNQWARKTRVLYTATATELLDELIDICPHLLPAREILLDLLQRMEHLLYVPLIFDLENKPLGVVVPIDIKADFAQSKPEPRFCVLGQGTEKKPSWLQLDKDFIRAIKTARFQTVKMLNERGYKPLSKEFKILVGLPDLRMFQHASLLYEHKSIELPVMLAGFCQYPEIKKTIKLNPAIMLMGPINYCISKDIQNLLEFLRDIYTLLITSEQKIPVRGICCHRPTSHNFILQDYLEPQDLKELSLRHSKVLTFETDTKWNRILIQAKKQKDPIIPTIKRHKKKLLDFIDQHKAIQLRGLTGIGKTFLVAQWLEKTEVQNRYGLILYTSVPDTSASTPEAKQEIVSKWARKALDTLSRQLSKRNFEGLELKCRADPGLLDRATEFVEALREALADMRVLWIIDNGQALQYPIHNDTHEEQFTLEHRFAEIIQQVHTGEWQGCELLYITNQELAEPSLPVYPLDDGFTFEEACEYLDKVKWPFDLELSRDVVARALGAHPKALELLVKHAKDKSVSAADIQDILTSLPSSTGERELRLTVCHNILEHIFTYLKNYHLKAWWMLMTASTFMHDFNREQFKYIAKKVISNKLGFDFRHDIAQASRILEDKSLLSWNANQRLWNMHSLVRHYSQDVFLDSESKLYQQAHHTAGLYYFPLHQKGGWRLSDLSSKAKYANGENCAMALYHYEQAQYESGKQAVFQNYYEHPIAKARQFIDNKQPREAEQQLKKVLQGYTVGEQGDPLVVAVNMVSSDINYLVAKAIHYQRNPKRYDISALHYRQAMKQGKKEIASLLIILLCDMVAGKPETDPLWKEAESLFNEVSQSVANNEEVSSYENLGEMYEKVAQHYFYLNPDDPEMSLLILEEAAEANIAWFQLYQLGAKIMEKIGQQREAERWLQKAIEIVPNYHEPYIDLVQYLLKKPHGQKEVKQIYKNYIQKFPNAEIYKKLGLLLEEQQPKLAEYFYKDCIKKIQTNVDLYLRLGNVMKQQNKPDEAEKVYKNGIEKVPSSNELYIAYGRLLEQQNKPDEAETVYKKGIEKVPQTFHLYITYGHLLEQQNKPDEAETVYKKGIEKVPQTFDLYIAYGRLLEQQNKPDEAEQIYQTEIDKNPNNKPLYIALFRFLERHNKLDEAEEVYKKGIEKVPPTHYLYIAYGRLLEQQNKPDGVTEAENTCKIGIQKSPSGYLYLTLGYVLELQNKSQEAEDIYRMGINNFPKMSYIYMALGYLLEEQNRLQEAKDTYQMGIEQTPASEILHDDLEQLERKGI